MGTDELKSMFKLGADLAKFIESAIGSHYLVLLTELPKIVGDLKVLSKASLALAEYAAMTDAQAVDLEAYVATVVSLDNQSVQNVIELAFKALVDLHGLVDLFKAKS